MTFILTLVASEQRLTTKIADKALAYLRDNTSIDIAAEASWLSAERAAEWSLSAKPGTAEINKLRAVMSGDQVDLFITPAKNRKKSLLIADMDSTIVEGETLDDLADSAGIKDRIAKITARAMNGELDFEAAVKERVSLLKGLPVEMIQDTLEKTTLSKGARTLVATMSGHGGHCVLVSGGFTVFTAAIAAEVKFDAHHGNHLVIKENTLSGTIKDPIMDKAEKAALMNRYLQDHNLGFDDSLAVGDGANDLPMLAAAGLGIGYRPKPLLQKQLDNQIRFGDLTAVLYAQGYGDEDIAYLD